MPTTGSGLFPYPNSSAVPDVPADILLLAQKIDLIASGWTVTADATTRAALVTNGFAYEGLHVYQIDTKALYIYQSSAWVLQYTNPGLAPMIPTSVSGTGVSVGAGGKVTFTSATAIGVNGCFTSAFENYLVFINVPTGPSGGITMQMAAAGTPTSAANYDYQVFSSSAAAVTAAFSAGGTSWPLSGNTATVHDMELKLFRPQLAVATTIHQTVLSTPNPAVSGTTVYSMRGFLHRLTTAYDGFALASAAMTGTIRIYGFNNN